MGHFVCEPPYVWYEAITQEFVDVTATTAPCIAGGGSGHEPSMAGLVGDGLLTAAAAGDMFASPTAEAVLAALRAVTGPAGALCLVLNYTGDPLASACTLMRHPQQTSPFNASMLSCLTTRPHFKREQRPVPHP